jgi:hypothetical protein
MTEYATLADPKNFYAGRRVRIIERRTWGAPDAPRVWCNVEVAPGLTTFVREEHLANVHTVEEA